MPELTRLPLRELAAGIEARKISPVELTNAVLREIEAHDGELNAYISVYGDEALESARAAEAEIADGGYRGPLHGIPMGIKDNFSFENRITTMGSTIHARYVPHHDATVISKLRESGATFLGKLNLHEYALGVTTENPHYGTARNPWNRNKIAGGSSGGAGVAIPTGMSIGSIGSDTSGSIRIPAACCGIVGLKATYGRVSKFGCFPEAWTLDHAGPMARTVGDVATLLDAVTGYDPRDPTSLKLSPTATASALTGDIEGTVVGINEAFFFKDVDEAVATVVREGIRSLEARGAVIEPVEIPHIEDAEYAITIIDTSETSTVHHRALQERPQDYGDDVRFLLECGEIPSAVDYLEAQQMRARLRTSFAGVFERVDVLVAPTLPIATPDIGQASSAINGRPVDTVEALMRLVGPANLLGLPSLSAPCGVVDDMPVGLQIVGPPLAEQAVLNIGRAVEEAGLFQIPDLPR